MMQWVKEFFKNDSMIDYQYHLPYQVVIFDVDGTLVDSFPLFIGLLNRHASKYQYAELNAERIEYLRSFPPRTIRRELGLSRLSAIRLALDCKRSMQQHSQQPVVFDGMDQLLQQLKQAGICLAVVTSNSLENCHASLGQQRFALFDWIMPNASIYGKQRQIRKVLRHTHCSPQRAIYIGDQISDIHSAQALGMPVAAVTWGFNHAHALAEAKPTYLCQTVDELTACLLP